MHADEEQDDRLTFLVLDLVQGLNTWLVKYWAAAPRAAPARPAFPAWPKKNLFWVLPLLEMDRPLDLWGSGMAAKNKQI